MDKKITIGIINSNNLFKSGLKILLENNGFKVDLIGNNFENQYDIVFLECAFVDECVNKIISIQSYSDATKIVILTDLFNCECLQTLIKLNINGIISHNIDENFLIDIFKFVYNNGFIISGDLFKILQNSNIIPICQPKTSREQFKNTHSNLTQREYEVLKLIVDGKSNAKIAELLTISEHTAKAHVCNIIQKLVVDDRTQAAVKAIRDGIV